MDTQIFGYGEEAWVLLSIAVVEDDAEDANLLEGIIARYFGSLGKRVQVDRYPDGLSFLAAYQYQYAIVFLDIALPGMDGLRVAKSLRERDTGVLLIFITNHGNFAIHGYDVEAIDFILKPANDDVFSLKMPKVLRQLSKRNQHEISVTSKGKLFRFSSEEIQYVEVSSHRLTYHTTHGSYEARGSLSEVEMELHSFGFRRCNSCYLVNLAHVKRIDGGSVVVGEEALSVSRSKRKRFYEELTNYIGVSPWDP